MSFLNLIFVCFSMNNRYSILRNYITVPGTLTVEIEIVTIAVMAYNFCFRLFVISEKMRHNSQCKRHTYKSTTTNTNPYCSINN